MEVSSATRSKSKYKMATKKLPKSFSKHPNNQGKTRSSGYDPHLGTFRMIETSKEFPTHGHFKNIDDMENCDGDTFKTIECDSASNNVSCSLELLPGADNDKREKARRKNEKKHRRRRERRAKELHERCSSYLISRKLEALTQELVNMGFSHEQATLALILHEGRIQESVSWILKACKEGKSVESNIDAGRNLKLDVSEELMRISDMEAKYKASKQEIERIVITYEGDLEKVEDIMKEHSKEPSIIAPKREERSDRPATSGPSIDPRLKSSQEPKNMQPKLERARAKAEKTCPLAAENEMKNSQRRLVMEPVFPMLCSQNNAKPVPNSRLSLSSPKTARARCSNNIDTVKAHKSGPPVDFSICFGDFGPNPSLSELNRQVQQQCAPSNSSTDTQMIHQVQQQCASSNSSTDAQMITTTGNKSRLEYWSVTHNRYERRTISHFDYKSVDWSSGLESLIAQSNGHSFGLFTHSLGPKKSSSGSFPEWSSPFEEKDLFSLQRLLLSSPSL